jgi:hypothetical protein
MGIAGTNDYTLLIQGPILSVGRTGKTFYTPLSKDSFVNYDCHPNLIKLVSDFGNRFCKIYIITWDNELIDTSVFLNFKNCEVVQLKNPTPNIIIDNQQFPTDFNNKYKQFYALTKGAALTESKKGEYIVKTRTDQYLDLDLLLKEHKEYLLEDKRNRNKIFVPYVFRENYLVSDFYFVAEKEIFIKFTSSMLWGDYLEFNSSVHLDMSLKYAFLHFRDQLMIPDRTFFLNSFRKNINRDKVILQNFLTANVYSAFSESIVDSIIWRGQSLVFPSKSKDSYVFHRNFNSLLMNENKYSKSGLADLLFINFPSFFAVKFPKLRKTFIYELILSTFKLIKKILK